MHTIIKIAVVSVLSLFAIVGMVSISKAEEKLNFAFSDINPDKLQNIKCDRDDTVPNSDIKYFPPSFISSSANFYSLVSGEISIGAGIHFFEQTAICKTKSRFCSAVNFTLKGNKRLKGETWNMPPFNKFVEAEYSCEWHDSEPKKIETKIVKSTTKKINGFTNSGSVFPSWQEKLKFRSTINVFQMANSWEMGTQGYSLIMAGNGNPHPTAITLTTSNWSHYNKGDNFAGVEKFLTKRDFPQYYNGKKIKSIDSEYGKMTALDYSHPDFNNWFSDVIKRRTDRTYADGVWFDFWHNGKHNGFTKSKSAKLRVGLAKHLEETFGDDVLILGNINWGDDRDTIKFIHGAVLELEKSGRANQLFNNKELIKLEKLLFDLERDLKYPKLILVGGARKTKNLTDEDRNTPENRKMAKLLTAMSVVIPTNGYINYFDNNDDSDQHDKWHLYYDFYSFDIGKPTSEFIKLKDGVGYKMHEKGIIAYNILKKPYNFSIENGLQFTIDGKSGLFCEFVDDIPNCLSFD